MGPTGAARDATQPALAPWDSFCERYWSDPGLGVWLDVSRVRVGDGFLDAMASAGSSAVAAMAALEAGAIANADESRMVGHYWLRAPSLAPDPAIGIEIHDAVLAVQAFARAVRDGQVQGGHGSFCHLVHVGIGGSALGPQLAVDALSTSTDPIDAHFLDNADPDGIDRLLGRIGHDLGRTLVSVASKSGWTPTTRHVLRELEARYQAVGLDLSDHAVATTMAGSELDSLALEQRWLCRFPIWDWVGGRTSVCSAVGLLPAALVGADIDALLSGAAEMDAITRRSTVSANPALLLSLMWYWLGSGRGDRQMVVLPHRDRLALLPRYVQQLVMESVGKELDRDGNVVHQGLTVYGNKGATDQHAYLQQVQDGRSDVFAMFVAVEGSSSELTEVEPEIRLADYLFASLEGTARTLYDRGRDSVIVGVPDGSAKSLGALIALFERTVGLYAELVNVNAYHQPGVDKEAAKEVVALHRAAVAHLRSTDTGATADAIATAIGRPDHADTVFKVLRRLAGTDGSDVVMSTDFRPAEIRFSVTVTKDQVVRNIERYGEPAWTSL